VNSKHTSMKLGLLALVITIALAATVALIGVQSVTAEGGAVAPEIEGTWLATITIQDGPPSFPSLVTYARGGALTVTDSSIAPALGNAYQGTWTKTGPHEFAFTFLGFQFDANGVFANYIRARETIQLQRDGKAYNGVSTIEILDTAQNVLATMSSTSHATRVNAQ
jgi:hypothetical protein